MLFEYSFLMAFLLHLHINSVGYVITYVSEKKIKKCSERSKHCMLAVVFETEPRIFTPLQTPFPEVQNGQNLISWRWSLPLPINPVW